MLTAKEARDIRIAIMDEYAQKADKEVQKMLPQIEDQITKACKKTALSTTVNLIYLKDYDPLLRRAIREKLMGLLNELGYYASWEDTVTEKSSSSWWRKKNETTIDKIAVEWRYDCERYRS